MKMKMEMEMEMGDGRWEMMGRKKKERKWKRALPHPLCPLPAQKLAPSLVK